MGVDVLLVYCADSDPGRECGPDAGWCALGCKPVCHLEVARRLLGIPEPGACDACPLRLPAVGLLAKPCWPRLSVHAECIPALIYAHDVDIVAFVRTARVECGEGCTREDCEAAERWLAAVKMLAERLPRRLAERIRLYHWG